MNYEDRIGYTPESKDGISTPANNSIKQSRYIAALDRYLGMSGFAFPVTDVLEGVEYRYDLYHPESEQLVKVFTSLDEKTLNHYGSVGDARDVIFIFDADNLTELCSGCGKPHFDTISEEVLESAEEFGALIFLDGRLWNLDQDNEWEPIIPLEREKCVRALFDLDELD